MITPKEYYSSRMDSLAARIAIHRRRNRLFVGGEIASFALFIAFIFAYAQLEWGSMGVWAAVLSIIIYVVIRRMDEQNEARTEWLEALREVCSRELAYLDGDYSAFDDGERYADPQHPFTMDMDVFGNKSLFQRINRSVTTGGSDRLAALLSAEPIGKDGVVADCADVFDAELSPVERIRQRGDAIDILAHCPDWRTEFCAVGIAEKINTDAVARAMRDVSDVKVGKWVMSPLTMAVAMFMGIGLIATIVLAAMTDVPSNVAVVWALAQLGIVLGLCHAKLMEISRTVGKLHGQMAAYVKLVRIISEDRGLNEEGRGLNEEGRAKSEESVYRVDKGLIGRLVGATGGAIGSFREIEKILAGLDRRGNILGLTFADIFTLSDFRLLRRFALWQRHYTMQMSRWIAAVNEMDALVSMATFCYNEPQGVRAEVVNGNDVVCEARGLYHPFIGSHAVRNDFNIAERNYYIITGANMAGKSTFLRSLGVNWILAMNGLPVFADQLRISVFPLFTSMRTTDDLTRGISYFNAELLRLKSLIAFCASHDNTLIILDEILKGTNSADKLGGSRLFLEYMSNKRVTGVIATHDLELSRLADEQPERFHNYCFEIELGTDVTYTYKITQGVARNQNATFLLKELLK